MLKKFTLFIILALCTTIMGFAQSGSSNNDFNNTQQQHEKLIKLYPNPASSYINFEIQTNNDNVYQLIVYNFLGKKIDELKAGSGRNRLNLDKYYSGIYIYQLRDGKGNLIESGKFNVIK